MYSLFSPILAVGVYALAHILIFRSRRGVGYFRSVVESFAAGALAFAIIEIWMIRDAPITGETLATALLVNAPAYAALAYCAYSFFQLSQTSIRIRIFSEIAERPGGVSLDELKREYDEESLMQVRLRRLIEAGDIVEKDGRYVVGRRRFVIVSRILFGAKRLLLGKRSEFE